jgi:hypothetical protein
MTTTRHDQSGKSSHHDVCANGFRDEMNEGAKGPIKCQVFAPGALGFK